MTGAQLSLYFDQKSSSSYTGYLDNTKKNRLFKDALISIVEKTWKGDYNQKEWDEITFLTNTNVEKIPSNLGTTSELSNVLLSDSLQITSVTIGSATTFSIETYLPHCLDTGQQVTISGVAGSLTMGTANGTFNVAVNTQTNFTITVASATGVYTANTGIVITPYTVSDYWHLLAIKCLFNTQLYNITVSDATNKSPIVVTLSNRSIVRSGSQVVISGVTGNTAANGTFYAKVKNDFDIALYSDVNLQIPVVGNGTYVSGGIISIVNYNYASPLTSKMKQGVLNTPTPQDPYFEIANNQIKVYPRDQTCSRVKFDYIRIPSIVIDVNDATVDLVLYYPEKFLYAIVDRAMEIFAMITRDQELFQESNIQQQKNP